MPVVRFWACHMHGQVQVRAVFTYIDKCSYKQEFHELTRLGLFSIAAVHKSHDVNGFWTIHFVRSGCSKYHWKKKRLHPRSTSNFYKIQISYHRLVSRLNTVNNIEDDHTPRISERCFLILKAQKNLYFTNKIDIILKITEPKKPMKYCRNRKGRYT